MESTTEYLKTEDVKETAEVRKPELDNVTQQGGGDVTTATGTGTTSGGDGVGDICSMEPSASDSGGVPQTENETETHGHGPDIPPSKCSISEQIVNKHAPLTRLQPQAQPSVSLSVTPKPTGLAEPELTNGNNKDKNRRVSFPDDGRIVSGYMDPPSPWNDGNTLIILLLTAQNDCDWDATC